MITNKETLKFKLLTFIRYFGDAFFYPFFALYLKHTGLVEGEIGFILSITPIISIIANPIYSFFCKNSRITKNILKVITVLEAIVITIIGFSNNFYLVSALTILLALFGSCHYGLMDSFTAVYANISNTQYSTIRIFGSIAYIIATTIGGGIVEKLGYSTSFIIASILFIASGLLYQLIKPFDNLDKSDDKSNTSRYSKIFKNKYLIIFLIFYTILNSTNYSIDSFLSTFYKTIGVDAQGYGIVYSYYVIFEVITMIILSKIKRRPTDEVLFIIASILYTTRMFVFYLNIDLTTIIIITSFKGIVNGIINSIMFPYLIKLVGPKLATTATLIFNTVHSIYIALGNNIFGNIIEKYGYSNLYLIGFIISLIALTFSFINYISNKKRIV